MTDKCVHMNFAANVTVNRLEDNGQFNADVTIRCADCSMPFRFLGLPLGMNLQGAAMSPDGLEARLAILPQDRVPSPLQGLTGYSIGARPNG